MSSKEYKKFNDQKSVSLENTDSSLMKYPHPKILLIDTEDEIEAVLKSAGYNVSAGSFGRPYKVPVSDSYERVIDNASLHQNFTEKEIIIIDLNPPESIHLTSREQLTDPCENDFWASCSRGEIDPRPLAMGGVKDAFDRILLHGGVFIIFAAERSLQNLVWGHLKYYIYGYPDLIREEDIVMDNWSFLSILHSQYLETKLDYGEEISVETQKSAIAQLLSKHIKGADFLCTLHPDASINNSWNTLAKHKYGAAVAGEISIKQGQGRVFIFPRLHDRSKFLVQFFNNVLPDLSPHLFPYGQKADWLQRAEYELPKVLEFKTQIQQIEEEAKRKVAALEESIEEERATMSYLHDLIKATGEPLVRAVKKTLEVLGFQAVVDVDKEREEAGDKLSRDEDLQIRDYSPLRLVEVKGINFITDDEALAVQKYVGIRKRDLNRTDIYGLSIINHQINLPPLDRENKAPFRKELLNSAEEQKIGLLTTWDLFRLTRSYLKNGWKHEHIKELFYQSGRIDIVPKHYQFIGCVEKFYPKSKAVTVWIEQAELKQGDCIAFELPVEFEEQEVQSLRENEQSVSKVDIGGLAGIETHLTKKQAKKGVRVFRIIEPTI